MTTRLIPSIQSANSELANMQGQFGQAANGVATLVGAIFGRKAGQIAGAVAQFGMALAGGGGGGFGGFRADEGPVMSGRMYMVGERGPEMFVPKTPGLIVPNGGFGPRELNVKVTPSAYFDVVVDQRAAAVAGPIAAATSTAMGANMQRNMAKRQRASLVGR